MTRDESTRAASLLHALDRRELAAYRQRGAVARQLNVSDEELLVLLHLVEHDGATHGELTTLLGLSRSGMSAMVQRLEHAGYVARHAHPADRRIRRIVVTDDARDRLRVAYSALADAVERVLAGFSPDEHETLVRLLDELAAIADPERPAALAGGAEPDREWRLWR